MLAAAVASGCATSKERGDRAFVANRYNEALDHYEREIDGGSRDAQLYYRAAKAAVRIGDFSLAERYYSRSLRYGGGHEVARSLAQFYLSTSNFTKAVRVLQELLESTEEPQPVFNNLGAALMYAGAPLDAEAYLLVAQQMRPSDPVPYINLGVLYDKHMHQPRLAMGFYQCFLELGSGGRQQRKIVARVRALEARFGPETPRRFAVSCGEPYRPAGPPSKEEVQTRLAETEGADLPDESAEATDAKGERDIEPERTDESTEPDGEDDAKEDGDDGEYKPPVIHRQVEDWTPPDQASGANASAAVRARNAIRLAERAFSNHNHAEVVRQLESVPAAKLDTHAMSLYGRSLVELDKHQRAQRWLAAAVAEAPSSDTVAALVEVYGRVGATQKLAELCERFAADGRFEDALEECPPGKEPNKRVRPIQ